MNDDYHALRAGAGLWDRAGWHLRRFTGATRLEFLHKYITQDVARLQPGQGAYGCCLTVKGGLVGDVWLLVRAEDVLVVCAVAAAESLYKHLGRYALFDRIAMDDLAGEQALRSLWGPEARATLESVLGAGLELEQLAHVEVTWQEHTLCVARNDLADTPGWDLIVPAAGVGPLKDALEQAGARPVGAEAIEQVRIEAGVPLYGLDMTAKTIPIEAGLEERAISYDKGCYIGQEVIARIKHRGRINRHLLGFKLDTDGPVETPATLHTTEKEVGEITSSARSPRLDGAPVGLGILHRKYMEPGTELHIGGPEGPLATVCQVPFQGS